MQLVSPRPYQMMHSEQPEAGELVHRRDEQHHRPSRRSYIPNVFRGVCGLPQSPGVSPENCLKELEGASRNSVSWGV